MKERKERLQYSFWVSLLVSVTFCVFGPLEMIMSSTSEFWFSVTAVLPMIALCTVLLFGILFVASYLLAGVTRLVYPVLLGLGIALYIQGNFMFVSYGVMNGTAIDWDSFGIWPVANSVIWILLIGAPVAVYFLKREWLNKLLVYIPLAVVVMQTVTLGTLVFTTDLNNTAQSDAFYLSTKGIDEISGNENVVCFVMDTFDDDYFKKIQEEDPAFLEPLDGFVFFANNTGVYPTTKGAMPYILSGQAYRNEQPYKSYINDAYYKTDYYTDLKEAGYDITLYTKSMFVDSQAVLECLSNVETSGELRVSSHAGLISTVYKATAFRYFPHIAKKSMWYYTGDFDQWKTTSGTAEYGYYTTENLDLYNAVNDGKLHISDELDKAYRLYYCYGVHPPYKLREDLTEVNDGSVTYIDASKGCLNILYDYIAQLKELGVYDQTTIVVMSDHGRTSGLTNPLFLVKPRNQRGHLEVSNAPVSQQDLFGTIMTDAGLNEDGKYGRSAFSYAENENRDRMHLYYSWDENWDADYLPTIVEYSISPENNEISAFSLADYAVETYQIGTRLSFAAADPSAKPYCINGFSGSEEWGTWTDSQKAFFALKINEPVTSDLQASITLGAAYAGSQDVTILMDDYALFHKNLTAAETIKFVIPADLVKEDTVELTFELPDAVSPLERGEGADSRTLALPFQSIVITMSDSNESYMAVYEAGQTISYGAGGTASAYVSGGIDLTEAGHSWTIGKESALQFDLGGIPTSDLQVTLDLCAVYSANGSQPVKISANGTVCYENTLDTAQVITFTVPKDAVTHPYLTLRLEHPNAVSPKEATGAEDNRELALDLRSLTISYDGTVPFEKPEEERETAPVSTQNGSAEASRTDTPAEEEKGFSITDIVAIPLTAVMMFCHKLLGNYGLTILVFTLLSKIILLPVSLWVHRNGITMVRITPEVNRIKIKHFGDKDTIDDETQALYKREKYNPLASTVPMIVQIIMLLGVIGAVKSLLADADSLLTLVPSEAGGITYLMPVGAGMAALALGLAQNRLNPLQREQNKKEQWMSNGFSIGISLFLGAFVSLGVGIYWVASNLLSIVQQMLLNVLVKPEKYIDYAALEASKKELASLDSLSKGVSKEDKKREQEDYKRFFSVANKHLVFYSEKSGFYKYYKDVMDFMLRYSNVIIHYVTNDPKDQIFKIAEQQPRIRPYYISEKKLITLLMKMDADVVVMTCPDLDQYHLKRSYVRKDIEYVYMFHYPLSTHMVLNNGALDHYDTILCIGDFQFEEIRAAERLYGLPEKKLISAGYGQLEQLYDSYQKMEKVKRETPKILIAPSWQLDNILDSCLDPLLEQLLGKGYEVVIRPHPEYVKRYKPRMDAIVQRYSHHRDLTFELDFTSNNSLFDSDILISDWSGSAYEFSLVTLKPAVFVNTPPKINNPEYHKLNVEPLEFKLRSEVGIQIDPANMEGLDQQIRVLLDNSQEYAEKIEKIRDTYIAHFGKSGEVGGKYILGQLLERQNKK